MASKEYYNYGGYSFSLRDFRNREVVELENYYEEDIEQWKKKYNINDNTRVIWVTKKKEDAYSYSLLSDEIDDFDFSKVSILGKYTVTGGYPPPIYIRVVTKNDELKKYRYNIKVIKQDMSDVPNHSMNWIAIPKIPDGYTVEFIAKRERAY